MMLKNSVRRVASGQFQTIQLFGTLSNELTFDTYFNIAC